VPHLPLWAWWTPDVLVWIALAGVGYAWVFYGPLRDRLPGIPPPNRSQAFYFYAGLLLLYAALGSPLGALAMGYLYTAHMVQHMLAAIAVPPLLIIGLPKEVWRAVFNSRLGGVLRWFIRPIAAIVAFNVVFSLMVYPPVIVAMVDSMAVMVALHLLLVLTGMIVWWPMISPLAEAPRLHPAQQMLYLFGNSLAMILPLALVLFAGKPIYGASYVRPPSLPMLGQLGELGDQELGAATCLTFVHTVYLILAVTRFYEWAHMERGLERRVELAPVIELAARRP